MYFRRFLLVPLFALIPYVSAAQTNAADLEAVVTTSAGTIRFEFAPDKAPKHVENFIKWARQGYYDGSAFHRTISYGIIQGGDPLLKDPKTARALWGTGGLKLQTDEFSDMKHERGVVSTVRLPNQKNSDGSQFFICVSPQASLDGQYSAFGRVTEGMDIVEKISQSKVDSHGFAESPVRILKITIEKKKTEPFADAAVDQLRRTVTMKTTLGTLKIKLEPDWAPNHARNFLKLVETGWYNGTAFHRVIKGFMAQGGMGDTREAAAAHPADRWVHPIKGEFRQDLQHVRGLVSMARTDDPDSATTSFFLMLAPAPHLDGKYTIFGRVVEGLEVLDAFEKEELDGETPKRSFRIIEAVVDPI